MKIGDKVYCIKSYRNDNGRYAHLKNKTYVIDKIDEYNNVKRVWIISEPSSTSNGYIGYIIYGRLYSNFTYFKEYFLTITDHRKRKLEKINENR